LFTLTGALFTLTGALFTTDLGLDGVGLRLGFIKEGNALRCFALIFLYACALEREIILRVLFFTGAGILRITFFVKGERLIVLVEDFARDTAFLYAEDFLTDFAADLLFFFIRLSVFLNENPKSP